MGSKYQQINHDDEKFEDVFPPNRSSSSMSDSTLLEDEEDRRLTQPKRRWTERWMWLVHAVLLSLSFTMFVSSWFASPTTLDCVTKYAAYCM